MTDDADPAGERWRAIDRLFDAALDQPAAGRLAFLHAACGDDVELRDAVVELLGAEESSRGLFESPGPVAARGFMEDLVGRTPPDRRLGPYTLVRELGRGGMGTVYLAEQVGDEFRRKVAIKVLRRGVDTDDVLRRFVRERRKAGGIAAKAVRQALAHRFVDSFGNLRVILRAHEN